MSSYELKEQAFRFLKEAKVLTTKECDMCLELLTKLSEEIEVDTKALYSDRYVDVSLSKCDLRNTLLGKGIGLYFDIKNKSQYTLSIEAEEIEVNGYIVEGAADRIASELPSKKNTEGMMCVHYPRMKNVDDYNDIETFFMKLRIQTKEKQKKEFYTLDRILDFKTDELEINCEQLVKMIENFIRDRQ